MNGLERAMTTYQETIKSFRLRVFDKFLTNLQCDVDVLIDQCEVADHE